MAQFGVGPELSAQCPRVPTPDGWRTWTDADGAIPEMLSKRAQALVDDASTPLGATESYPLPGVTTLIRVEPHVWGRDAQGALVQGCFRAGVVFLPSGTPTEQITAPSPDKTAKIVGTLTAASLVVGIIATLASLGGDS